MSDWRDEYNEAAADALDAAEDEQVWRDDRAALLGIEPDHDHLTPMQEMIAEHMAISRALPDDDNVNWSDLDWTWLR